MVQEPVEDGGGDDLVGEDLAPLGEGLVAGDDDRAAFVAVADQLEHHVRRGPVAGQVAHFVEDQDRGPKVGLELAGEPAGGFGGTELTDAVIEAGEVDRVPGLAGGDGERDRDVGLPGAAGSGR